MKIKSLKFAAILAATVTAFSALVGVAPANAALAAPTIGATLTTSTTVDVTALAGSAIVPVRTHLEYQISTQSSFASSANYLVLPTRPGSPGYVRVNDGGTGMTALAIAHDNLIMDTAVTVNLSAITANQTLYVRARELNVSSNGGVVSDGNVMATDVTYTASAWSTSVTIARPSAPAKPAISTDNSGNIVVDWNQTAALGGNSSYAAAQVDLVDETAGSTAVNLTGVGTGSTGTYTYSAYTLGHTYHAVVRTHNVVGYSPSSVSSDSVSTFTGETIGSVSALAVSPDYSQLGSESFTLDWSAPIMGSGSVTGYKVEWKLSTASTWNTRNTTTKPISIASTTFAAGSAYNFRVTPYHLVSTTYTYGRATTFSTAVTSLSAPGLVTALAGVAGDSQVTLTWTAPANNGGSAITHYWVYYGTSVASIYSGNYDAGTATTYTVSGLTNGTGYYFKVFADNDFQENSTGTVSALVSPALAPDSPASATATAGNGSATVTWTDPAHLYGQTVTDYQVEYKTVAASTWATYPHTASTNKSLVVNGLANGTAYTFRVSTVAGLRVSSTPTVVSAAATPLSTNGSVALDAIASQGSQAAGSASVLTNGAVTASTVTEPSNTVRVYDTSFLATFKSLDVTGGTLPLDGSSHLVVRPGQKVSVVASGFKPNSKVRLYLFSNATLVASGTASSTGVVSLSGKLPSSLAAGTHTLQLNGANNDNDLRSISVGVSSAGAFVAATNTVKFAVGVKTLSTLQKRALRTFNSAQVTLPSVVRVVGYTYGTATKASLSLALARAKAIVSYLKKLGVTATVITSANTGKTTKAANGRQVVISYFH